MATKKKSKKKPSVEMTLWDVILSYPDLHDPKPFKGKIYYRTDCLMDEDHPQLADLRAAIKSVKVKAFGTDKSEWPEMKNFIQDGNAREDQKGYADKKYITVSTQTPVPVIDLKDKPFNPQSVKGGMFANVAIRISAWEYDGDEGVSIYLQGVQIDTSKASLKTPRPMSRMRMKTINRVSRNLKSGRPLMKMKTTWGMKRRMKPLASPRLRRKSL